MNNTDRERTRSHLLKEIEGSVIKKLCGIMPRAVTPNHLTFIGFIGSLISGLSLLAAREQRVFLFLAILGLAVNWFGDSLDGRLAYFRNTPRKWFGFSLDVLVDWTSAITVITGFYYYFGENGFAALTMLGGYGGAMILALLNYKISGNYSIDLVRFGPTEMRLLLAAFFVLEFIFPGTLLGAVYLAGGLLIVINFHKTGALLKAADRKDKAEKRYKTTAASLS